MKDCFGVMGKEGMEFILDVLNLKCQLPRQGGDIPSAVRKECQV